MDIFSQHKLLIKTIIVLVIMNIVMMVFFILKETSPDHEPLLFPKNETFKDVSGILKKELNLSEKQYFQFNEIRKRNFEKQSQLKKIIRDDKDAMNVEMFNKNTNVDKINLFARKIAENEYKMQLHQYEQAKELKSVCTLEQLNKFEHLVLEIRDYFRPDNQPNKH